MLLTDQRSHCVDATHESFIECQFCHRNGRRSQDPVVELQSSQTQPGLAGVAAPMSQYSDSAPEVIEVREIRDHIHVNL
jgi:hypothetical protein